MIDPQEWLVFQVSSGLPIGFPIGWFPTLSVSGVTLSSSKFRFQRRTSRAEGGAVTSGKGLKKP